jgi:phosphonatase-like hydrolase
MAEPISDAPLVDLVALDMAGTTIQEHGAVYTALNDAVTAAGGAPERQDIEAWMGADKHQAIAALLACGRPEAEVVQNLVVQEQVDRTYLDFRGRLHEAYLRCPPEPIPGIPEAFRRLRGSGVKVALTTGFGRDIAGELLEALRWTSDIVDAVVTTDDVPEGRPAPYLVFRAMEWTGTTDVRRVLVAGDTVRDLESGINAGAGFVVAVLSGGQDATTLGAGRHTHLMNTAAGIPSLVLPSDRFC